MSTPTIYTFTETELRTYVRQVLQQWNKTGDTERTISFSVSLAGAYKIAADAKFAAIMAKAEPVKTQNLVETPTEVMKGL